MEKITQAIVLAGGKGTRLQSVVQDLPKPMAPIASQPFLFYQLSFLQQQGIEEVILSVGYKRASIQNHFKDSFKDMRLKYVIEETPLGTGGAIREALRETNGDVFILNGDTFFPIHLQTFYAWHHKEIHPLSIALKKVFQSDRYGTVALKNHHILGFEEKKYIEAGYINGGIYCCSANLFDSFDLPKVFSFETDFLQKYLNNPIEVHGYPFDDYFIDIGIPEDYNTAQTTIPAMF